MMLTVKLGLTAVFDAQHGGPATGSSPASWGAIDVIFVNLTMPTVESGINQPGSNHCPSILRRDRCRVGVYTNPTPVSGSQN